MSKLFISRVVISLIVVGALGFIFYSKFIKPKDEPVVATATEEKNEKEVTVKTEDISEEDNYPIHYDVPSNKEWIFSFDEPLDAKSITPNTVYVEDENGTNVNVDIKTTNDNHSVSISAIGGYAKGQYFELNMTEEIKYPDGESVSRPYKMGFFIARDKVKDIVYNKDIIEIDNAAIKSLKGNILILNESNVNNSLKVDDILKIPSDHEFYEEKAIKISKITTDKEKKFTKIEFEEPRFQELFEKLNLYESYNLTSDDVIIIPAEGVEMEKFASVNPNTLTAASNSEKASKKGEFQLTETQDSSIEFDYNKGFEFSLNNYELDMDGEKTQISGKIKLLEPETVWDIDMGFLNIERMNALMSYSRTMDVEQTIQINDFGKKFSKSKLKKLSKRKWHIEKEIDLGTIYCPVFPGVFLEGNISGVVGINLVTGETKLEIKHFVTGKDTTTFGAIKDKDGFKPVFDYDPSIDAGAYVKGTAEAKLTGEVQVGITALEVLGLGLEAEGGGYAHGEGFLGASLKDEIACYKYDYGYLFGGGVVVDGLWKDEILNLKMDEYKKQMGSENSCETLEDIIVSPKEISAKPGDTVELEIQGSYLDKSDRSTSEKDLLIGKKNKEKFDITTENKEVAKVVIREKKASKDKSNKYKSYKVLVKIPKEPLDDNTTLTVEYDGQFTKTIPIKLSGVIKEVPRDEAKKIVTDLMAGITKTFTEQGEKYNWSNLSNPPDSSILNPLLAKYASKGFLEGDLRKIINEYYCQCDQLFFPDTDFDVRFKLHENTGRKIRASGIQFVNDMGDGGFTAYYTVIRENDKWVLDNIEYVSYEKESMNVTAEEATFHEAKLDGKLINETTYNGQKAYIFYFPESDVFRGIYADSTEFFYEVPNELLPEKYQEEETIVTTLNGEWNWNIPGADGILNISNASDSTFDFSIFVSSGGHAGEISGTANISGDTATFTEPEAGCTLEFSMNNGSISVIESIECLYWHGAAVSFDGEYFSSLDVTSIEGVFKAPIINVNNELFHDSREVASLFKIESLKML